MKHPLIFYICTMTKEDEILSLLRDNNRMLHEICSFLRQTGQTPESDFINNVIANIIGNRIDPQK